MGFFSFSGPKGVTYGVMTDPQVEQALIRQPGMPMTRAKLSIPFIGKDVPSPSSEFAHPVTGRSLVKLLWSKFLDRNPFGLKIWTENEIWTENGDPLLFSCSFMTGFQHPAEDITIGLTLLSLRYEGLRMSDFEARDAPLGSPGVCTAGGFLILVSLY